MKNFINDNLNMLSRISLILLIIGGLQLGLLGLFGFSFIGSILGGFLSRLMFILIGVGAGFLIYTTFVMKKTP